MVTCVYMPETDLTQLCRTLTPRLHAAEFVFCSVDEPTYHAFGAAPICMFREREGLSVVLPRVTAETFGLTYTQVWALITCEVYSDLTAVGLLAVMTRTLAAAGICVNAVSAYHHDHLFVPLEKAELAVQLLHNLPKPTT
jgi:uncharacterized protein